MTIPTNTPHEVVGLFNDENSFRQTINALLEQGFDRADLSVLGSHQSLDATEAETSNWQSAFTALASDIKFEVPLIASGAIILAGGPVAGMIAAIVGAAVGGVAVKQVIDGIVAQPHSEEFIRSVEAGSIILWIRIDDPTLSQTATDVLNLNGAQNVHIHVIS